MRYIFVFILIIFHSYELFSYGKNEVGILYGIHNTQNNRTISSMKNTFFRFYQIQKPYRIFSSLRNSDQMEIYYSFYSVFYLRDFFRFSVGTLNFPLISSVYISTDNWYRTYWKGTYHYVLFLYGYRFAFFRRYDWEFSGGLGIIPDFNLEISGIEQYQSTIGEFWQNINGSFRSGEGYIYRFNMAIVRNIGKGNFKVSLSYQYVLSGNFSGKWDRSDIQWFWWNQNKFWITTDVLWYLRNKQEYESQNLNIFYEYPALKPVEIHHSLWNLSFGFGIYF